MTLQKRSGLSTLEAVLIAVMIVVAIILSTLLYIEWDNYTSLKSYYSALAANYTYLLMQCNRISSLYNGIVAGLSGTSSLDIKPGEVRFIGLMYVPAGCTVSGVLTSSATGPVTVYLGDWVSAMDYYAYLGGATMYGSWAWTRQWQGTSFREQITQYAGNAGSFYILVVENNNNYDVSYTMSFKVTDIECGG